MTTPSSRAAARNSSRPGPVEIALSLLVLAAAIVLALWLTARVFRVGILLHGMPPSPKEALRWMREA